MSMKIAYLILCHQDPEFVCRTAIKITKGTENHVFIHVDQKSPIEPFEIYLPQSENIHLLKKRTPVYWGGYGAITATISLFRAASKTLSFDRYVLMQGTDYPIKSNKEIADFFSVHADTEFIRAISEATALNNEDRSKYVLKHYMGEPGLWGRTVNYISYHIKKYWPYSLPRPQIKIDGKKCDIYRGWAQIALTEPAIQYILNFHDSHPKFNTFFKHVFAPDESYFHTIIYNSPFIEKTVDGKPIPESCRSNEAMLNLTYFEYPDLVRIFKKKADFELLNKSGYLYFRKATSESKELLDYIDLVHKEDVNIRNINFISNYT